MVSGGPYGIEDILGGAGFAKAIVILLVLPFLWCLPTALMIGELASAIPAEGGFYVWVRRALGPVLGLSGGWLSLSASIFDMAIYPAIFVLYLGKFNPALTDGWRGYAWSLAVVGSAARGICAARRPSARIPSGCLRCCSRRLRLRRSRASGAESRSSRRAMEPAGLGGGLSTGILVAMWNYMGWDNASTVAQEVENPQRNYPRAMIAAGPGGRHLHSSHWRHGRGRPLGGRLLDRRLGHRGSALGGPAAGLGNAVVAGGAITGIGMFNALVMSYSRLPMAMAEEGMLPLVVAKRNSRGVPWVSVCCAGWPGRWRSSCPSSAHLHRPDSLRLEPAAGVCGAGRAAHPRAQAGAALQGRQFGRCLPAGSRAQRRLIGYALYASRDEKIIGSTSALLFALGVGLLGPVLYWATALPLAASSGCRQAAD
jgi:hypothetical protein